MVFFFFDNEKFTIECMKEIHPQYEIYDGYIIVHQYKPLQIKETQENHLLYSGKIVHFPQKKEDVLLKIKEILGMERIENPLCVWSSKKSGGVQKTYYVLEWNSS